MKYTRHELPLIAHALGIKFFESVMSHKKKDKLLPNAFYRNFYAQRQEHEIWENLVDKGFAKKRKVFDENCYNVTDSGIEKFRSEFIEIVNYQPSEKRDLEYLKHRLNFYSNWYGYKFCDDNSEHIISSFINYFLKGFYMSHTTTDCVNRFKNELRSAKRKKLI